MATTPQVTWYTITDFTKNETLKDENGVELRFDTHAQAAKAYDELSKDDKKVYTITENKTRAEW